MPAKFTEALKKAIKTEFVEGFIDQGGARVYPSKDLVENAKTLDKNALNIAQALLQRVGVKLAKAIEDERNNPEYGGISAVELRELSHVASNAQKIGKLALGEAQEISKVSADVSAPDSYNKLIRHLEGLANEKASLGKHTIQ